ncbi:MAG: SDR family oxidoreductase, partial [Chloroflexota bacterium]
MKILIVGGTGMLGHRLWMDLSSSHDVWGTVRGSADSLPPLKGIVRTNICENVDALHFETVQRELERIQPDVVINCVGLIKQRENAKEPILAIDINTRFPHLLAALCKQQDTRLIHISTDCVFDGKKGMYTESDPTNAYDLYGRTKALGEVDYLDYGLTIRTSLIGREINTHYSLLEWFLSQSGKVKGFKKAIFSGFPTGTVSQILNEIILPRTELHGLYHVSAEPINKYDLLLLFKEAYNKSVEVEADTLMTIDRSLD